VEMILLGVPGRRKLHLLFEKWDTPLARVLTSIVTAPSTLTTRERSNTDKCSPPLHNFSSGAKTRSGPEILLIH